MNKIASHLSELEQKLIDMNQYIYENPELGNCEVKAYNYITALLKDHDFQLEEKFLGMETAFRGTIKSDKPGPTIVFMAEYDALPEIGHGCGHNMIATTSVGAGIVLSKIIQDLGGTVIVLGTPAEEIDGAKVDMVEAGVFEDVDVAFIAHPANQTVIGIDCLAMDAIEFEFIGKAAHAAASPEKGINALDGVIGMFNSINALREHLISSTRIHGVITEGGIAANIVPERAVAQFYVRATTKTYLKEVVDKVKNCAKGAALSTGATVNIRNYEKSYDNMVPNNSLIELVDKHFRASGIKDIDGDRASLGSADAGNVSHVCPTVHPMFAIVDTSVAGHTKAFAEATQRPFAIEQMKKVIQGFVSASIEIIENPKVLEGIQKDFKY